MNSSAWHTDWYNVLDYGLVGDGATDNTAALQGIIDRIAVAQRNSVIFFPDEGPYLIAGPLQDTARSNCQVRFPSVGINAKQYTITLKGCSRPTFSPSAYSSVPLPAGTRIKSTLTAGGGTSPSVFGGLGPAGGDNFECSYMVPGFEDIIIQTAPDPKITAVDFYHFTNTYFRDVSVIAGNSQSVLDSIEPTTPSSYGVRQPTHSSGINQRVEGTLQILGFYNGIHVGEGAIINDLGLWSCMYALNYEFAPGQSFINRCIIGWCPNTIRVSGQHCMRIAELDIERWVPGKGGAHPAWYSHVTDFIDPGDVAMGKVVYRTVIANVAYCPGAFSFGSGGTHVSISELNKS